VTERFTNEATTTLAAGINASATSLTVSSSANFPAANFRVRIDNEILLVTAVAGTTWTVTRAVEAVNGVQVAASHAVLATVAHVLTAGGLQQAITEAGTGSHPAIVVGSTNPTLASSTPTALADPTRTIATSAGSDIDVEARMTISSTGIDSINVFVRLDGGAWQLIADVYPLSGGRWPVSGTWRFPSVSAATHTIEMGWSNSGSVTATSYAATRTLRCRELR
jgi:hypothetical protein